MSAETIRGLVGTMEMVSGCWMPVFLETVAGSQERICIAVAAIEEDGGCRVERTLPPAKVAALLGLEAEGINRLIDWVVVDLADHLSTHRHFEGWQAPFSGFVPGQYVTSSAPDLNGLLAKARSLSTALSDL